MHWIFKVSLIVAGNAFALWLATRWVPGFGVSATFPQLIVIAIILAILNFFLKPLLTLVLGPIIVITLGVGVIIVNAIILWVLQYLASHLDFVHGSITIQTIPALILATLIISVINFIIHIAA